MAARTTSPPSSSRSCRRLPARTSRRFSPGTERTGYPLLSRGRALGASQDTSVRSRPRTPTLPCKSRGRRRWRRLPARDGSSNRNDSDASRLCLPPRPHPFTESSRFAPSGSLGSAGGENRHERTGIGAGQGMLGEGRCCSGNAGAYFEAPDVRPWRVARTARVGMSRNRTWMWSSCPGSWRTVPRRARLPRGY